MKTTGLRCAGFASTRRCRPKVGPKYDQFPPGHSPTATQPPRNRPTAGGGAVKRDPIVLCRAEPLDGPSSTAGARPAPDRPLRLQGLLLLGRWGLQRGRAPSGAPGLAVQLGRGPHGQCPGRARAVPDPAARAQLLAMSCWWPMTFSCSGQAFRPRHGRWPQGARRAWSACTATQGPGCIPRLPAVY
jgi:hypothetical protein